MDAGGRATHGAVAEAGIHFYLCKVSGSLPSQGKRGEEHLLHRFIEWSQNRLPSSPALLEDGGLYDYLEAWV